MEVQPQTKDIQAYLECSDIINFDNDNIINTAKNIMKKSANQLDYIKNAYEFVRDKISHSADINEDLITCTASEVLKAGHGICFAKSHLLCAILRCSGIPSGLCYQKLILDDKTAPILIYHGLNGVYLDDYDKWIRLDPRGNKEGVNAQFSIDKEELAFPVRPEKGEFDVPVVFSRPDSEVIRTMKECRTRTQLWTDLPVKLDYYKGEK